MALPLSQNVEKAIERLFSIENKGAIVKLLTEKCSDNIPCCKFYDADEMEDIRFQVMLAAFLSSLLLHVANVSIFIFAGVVFAIARNFLSVWKDTRFRKCSSVTDVLSLTILATIWSVGIPVTLGYFIAKVFKLIFF